MSDDHMPDLEALDVSALRAAIRGQVLQHTHEGHHVAEVEWSMGLGLAYEPNTQALRSVTTRSNRIAQM